MKWLTDLIGGIWFKVGFAAVLIAGAVWWHHSIYQDGWNARDALVAQQVAAASKKAVDEYKANVADATQINLDIVQKMAAETARQAGIAKSLSQRLAEQAKTPFCKESPNDKPLLGQSVLDDESVRLLNAARAGATGPDQAASAAHGGAQARRSAAPAANPNAG